MLSTQSLSYNEDGLPSLGPSDKRSNARTKHYSFDALACLLCFSLSRSILRKIFPLGLLGIESTNSTPPFSHLCLALCSSTCLQIAVTTSSSDFPTASLDFTTKALGTSPARSS